MFKWEIFFIPLTAFQWPGPKWAAQEHKGVKRGNALQLGRIVLKGSGQELLANEEVKAIYLGKKTDV